jgi:hypothetical protein
MFSPPFGGHCPRNSLTPHHGTYRIGAPLREEKYSTFGGGGQAVREGTMRGASRARASSHAWLCALAFASAQTYPDGREPRSGFLARNDRVWGLHFRRGWDI